MHSEPIARWMSWEGGVDLLAVTQANLASPNVILHVARLVHTPIGSCPAGMVLWQPDPAGAPVVMGFIATDEAIGRYFGPNLFAGTPFENAPVIMAKIHVELSESEGSARVEAAGHVFESRLSGFSAPALIHRPAGGLAPFWQQGVESAAGQATLKVDGQPVTLASTAGSIVAPCGVYAR